MALITNDCVTGRKSVFSAVPGISPAGVVLYHCWAGFIHRITEWAPSLIHNTVLFLLFSPFGAHGCTAPLQLPQAVSTKRSSRPVGDVTRGGDGWQRDLGITPQKVSALTVRVDWERTSWTFGYQESSSGCSGQALCTVVSFTRLAVANQRNINLTWIFFVFPWTVCANLWVAVYNQHLPRLFEVKIGPGFKLVELARSLRNDLVNLRELRYLVFGIASLQIWGLGDSSEHGHPRVMFESIFWTF